MVHRVQLLAQACTELCFAVGQTGTKLDRGRARERRKGEGPYLSLPKSQPPVMAQGGWGMQIRSFRMANQESGEGIWVHPCPACEHVCGVLGPLSRNITLGGHLRVPRSGLTRPILPAAPHPFEERVLTRPLPPAPGLSLSATRRPGECAELCNRKLSKLVRPPRSARVRATSLGWNRTAPLVRRPPCLPPRASWLLADCGSVPRGSSRAWKLLHCSELSKSTHHLIRRGA